MIQMYRKSVPGPLLPELDELIVGIRVVILRHLYPSCTGVHIHIIIVGYDPDVSEICTGTTSP
jgi:hypothetical protein